MATVTRPRPSSRPAPDSRPGPGWRWPVALFVATVAVHLVLVHGMRAPIIHTDEYAYLDIARALAHGGRWTRADYYPGYSVVLLPIAQFTRDPLTLYRGALVVNAVLAGATTLLAYVLAARIVPNGRRSSWVAAAVVVAAFPALLLASNLALSENLFVPVFLALVLLVHRTGADDAPWRWAIVGVVGGALLFVHPRALAVEAALLVTAVLVVRPWRGVRPMASIVAFVGSSGVVAAAARLLTNHVTRGADTAANRTGDVVSRNLDLSAAGKIVGEVAGQWLYIAAASVGLVVVGAVLAGRAVPRLLTGARVSPGQRAATFAVLAFAGVLAMAALFLSNGERLDHWVYGRYVEAVVAPLLVVAVVGAGQLPRRMGWSVFAAGAAIVVGCGALVTVAHHGATRGPLVRTNTMGIDAVFRATDYRLSVAAIVAVAVVGLAVAVALARFGTPIAALVVVALFVPSIVSSHQFLVSGSRQRAGERVVARTIDRLHRDFAVDERCVAYDDATYSIFHYWNYRLFLPRSETPRFDSRRSPSPCPELVISGRVDLDASLPGARLVTWEHDAPQGLWVLPGPLQDRVAAAGRLAHA